MHFGIKRYTLNTVLGIGKTISFSILKKATASSLHLFRLEYLVSETEKCPKWCEQLLPFLPFRHRMHDTKEFALKATLIL